MVFPNHKFLRTRSYFEDLLWCEWEPKANGKLITNKTAILTYSRAHLDDECIVYAVEINGSNCGFRFGMRLLRIASGVCANNMLVQYGVDLLYTCYKSIKKYIENRVILFMTYIGCS